MTKHGKGWMTGAALLSAALLLPACDGSDDAAENAGAEPAPEQAAPAPAPTLDDAAIAHIAVTANTIDADMGELALERSTNDEVRAFAETMIRDHRGVNEQAVALATRLGVTPTDNDVSRSLTSDASSARSRIEGLSGAEFDRAYMEREVAYHQAVLNALDDTLIPGATNAELRSLLETARGAVAAHLEHARSLSATLAGSGA
jgi:putative membrane protein